MYVAKRRTVIAASGGSFRFPIALLRNRSAPVTTIGSKIEQKCRTFWPHVKLGESRQVVRVKFSSSWKPLMYFCGLRQGCSNR